MSDTFNNLPLIVAKCNKCNRGYVWVNKENPKPICVACDCDGEIKLICEETLTCNTNQVRQQRREKWT